MNGKVGKTHSLGAASPAGPKCSAGFRRVELASDRVGTNDPSSLNRASDRCVLVLAGVGSQDSAQVCSPETMKRFERPTLRSDTYFDGGHGGQVSATQSNKIAQKALALQLETSIAVNVMTSRQAC